MFKLQRRGVVTDRRPADRDWRHHGGGGPLEPRHQRQEQAGESLRGPQEDNQQGRSE